MKHRVNIFIPLIFISSFVFLSASKFGSRSCSAAYCAQLCCGPCNGSYNGPCSDCCKQSCQASAYGYPFLAYRSQSWNLARQMAGTQQYINTYNMDTPYGNFSVALEYSRSFRPHAIAQYLFGTDLIDNALLIQGSRIENRNQKAWLADYFGLPQDFNSKVSFCPRIENIIAELDYYIGFDKTNKGLYARFFVPLVWSQWDLGMCERIINTGTAPFKEGYMYDRQVPRSMLPKCFSEAIGAGPTWGDIKERRRYGKMATFAIAKTQLADIQTILGWNVIVEPDCHVGCNLHLGIPAGNRPCCDCLFTPVIGNGKHWELGAGLTSKYIFWKSETDHEHYIGLYCDARFAHLFKTCHCRSFDFCKKTNSRYMLLAKMGKNNTRLAGGDTALDTKSATYQYQKEMIPAIHYTTLKIDVHINIQAEFAIDFMYVKDNLSIDIGYNFWARTGEQFSFDQCCHHPCDLTHDYVLKGDSDVYGYTYNNQATPTQITSYPLSSYQPMADIHGGQNMSLHNQTEASVNKGISNPQLAWVQTATMHTASPEAVYAYSTERPPPLRQLYTSIQPELLSYYDFDFCTSPSAISHKIFAHINYTGKKTDRNWKPYLGLGGEAEFGIDCNAYKFAVSQWGIWIKTGIAFE